MAKKGKGDEKKTELSDGTVAVNDAWTGMLAVSLLALVVGSGFLIYDWYGLYNSDVQPPTPMKVTGSLPGPPPKAGPPPAPKDGAPKDAVQPPPEQKDAGMPKGMP